MRIIPISLLLVACALHATTTDMTVAVRPSGSGTDSAPYLIESLANLRCLSEDSTYWASNLSFSQTVDIDAAETSVWNGGSGFSPIGGSKSFNGKYHGHGHVISGLTIQRASTSNVGLFAYVTHSTIDSLGLVNAKISGYGNVGALVGYLYSEYATVKQCYSTGTVTGANDRVGGLVGHTFQGTVVNSYSTATVRGMRYVGGLIGNVENGTGSRVSYSYSTGNVSGTSNVGGLIGLVNGTMVNNSYSTGNVSASVSYAGGLMGELYDGTLTYSYSTGRVYGLSYVGGLLGMQYDGTIQYNYSTGSVIGTGTYVGGLVGYDLYGSGSKCYWNTQISGKSAAVGVATGGYISAIGRTTNQMKDSLNLADLGSFSTIWEIRHDSTYPALRGLDNAPFAFADTIQASAFSSFLENDFDYETQRKNLVLKVDSAFSITNNKAITDFSSLIDGDSLFVQYRVGEVRTIDDTLWGNEARSYLSIPNNEPTAIANNKTFSTANAITFATIQQGTMHLGYTISRPNDVTVEVYSLLGQRSLVATQGMRNAGAHKLTLDVSSLHPGYHLVHLRVGGQSQMSRVFNIE